MWQQIKPIFELMEQALIFNRVENNIMEIRRVRFGMVKVCTTFLLANAQHISLIKEENTLQTDTYLSNPDE